MKSVKALFDKDGVCVGDKLAEMIFLINRNSNTDTSGSPAEKFFRRRPRSNLPNSLRREVDYRELQASRHRGMEKLAMKKGYKDKSVFEIGDRVLIQDVASTKKWDQEGTIIDVRVSEDKSTNSYVVKKDNGNDVLRNKRFLKIKHSTEKRSVTFSDDV